jgi:PAB-dependent poly(A)-specific ribonuclease subunit 2
LNAAITSPEAKQLWGTPGWLPEEIGVIVEQGQFFCYEGEDLKLHIQRGMHHITVYSLIGLAVDVDSGQHQKSHLVSIVNGEHNIGIPNRYLELRSNNYSRALNGDDANGE